jgi:hypothetical protein
MAKTVAKTDRNVWNSGAKKRPRPLAGTKPEPTRAELYARARMRAIVGASRMTKDELVLALRSH